MVRVHNGQREGHGVRETLAEMEKAEVEAIRKIQHVVNERCRHMRKLMRQINCCKEKLQARERAVKDTMAEPAPSNCVDPPIRRARAASV
ncbi:hypothetical protein V1509DRAFT_636358 [Lipomyces kononenkoae]